jgi:hypothetical protein
VGYLFRPYRVHPEPAAMLPLENSNLQPSILYIVYNPPPYWYWPTELALFHPVAIPTTRVLNAVVLVELM